MAHEYYITPTEYQRANDHGIYPRLLEQRVRVLAWEKERAIITAPRKLKNHGKWAKVAAANGICYQTFLGRVNVHGWDPRRAATQPTQDKQEQITTMNQSRRIFPAEIVAMAVSNGICYQTFRSRVKEFGWDMVEAATSKPDRRKRKK